MRLLPTFLSVIALLCCSALVLRLPSVSWVIPAYVLAQFGFSLVAFLGLQKGRIESNAYDFFFLATFSSVLVLAMAVTARLVCIFPVTLGFIVLLGALGVGVSTAAVAYYRLLVLYKSHVPVKFIPLCFQGAVLLICGFATLLTILEPSSPALHAISKSLAFFWLSTGAFLFSYLLGWARTWNVDWRALNLYVPSMLAIIAFGWLAFTLSSLQAETGQAAVLSDRVLVERQ